MVHGPQETDTAPEAAAPIDPLLPASLPAAALARRTDPATLGFATTADVAPFDDVLGQDRAAAAISLGVDMPHDGFNVFVMGPPGAGKRTLVMAEVASRAASRPVPDDWVYVNNFAKAHQPIAIRLPPGRGRALQQDMQKLVETLRGTIPAVLESEQFSARIDRIEAEFNERQANAFKALGAEALAEGVALLQTPGGFSFAPVKGSEVMRPEEFNALPEAERKRLVAAIEALQDKMQKVIRESMRFRHEQVEKVKEVTRETILLAVDQLVDALRERYEAFPRVVAYLDAVQADVLDNAEDFKRQTEATPFGSARGGEEVSLRRYAVNVLVENTPGSGAPVVAVDHPSYAELVGRVDHVPQFGTLLTDFGLVKGGALHRANGGYLLIDARKLLEQPFAWDALKRALKRREIRVESVADTLSITSTLSLEPEPIPLAVKVLLFGEREVYYLLKAYDAEFGEQFRIAADFADTFPRDETTALRFARLVGTRARKCGMRPLDAAAVARVLDHASRLAGDSSKLAADVERVMNVVAEADHAARANDRAVIGEDDIARAIEAERERGARVQEQLHEAILRGSILIDTEGERVGQVNGLSVFRVGDLDFAEPTRITATTRIGEGRVIDVQREVELGGAIHSKGVLILSGFLAARYSGNRPHAITASLVFEQTYSHVDGDSASLAELCAVISSLAGVPIGQSWAVTGSINQLGAVQPIGAVNEKIEGFFDVCRARGLTGRQGVVIPASNVQHLMLRDDVVAAVAAGTFAVHAVRTVDEAITLLTGVPAGEVDGAGPDWERTINGRVSSRLRGLAAALGGAAEALTVRALRLPRRGRIRGLR